MTFLDWCVVLFTVLFSVIWCGFYLMSYLNFIKIPVFEKLCPPVVERYPRLSVLITACNEAQTVGHVVNSLLEQDYPDLELIVINDRSTDNTGEIVDALAQKDKRVKAVHIEHLPDKWLGKVHALHTGAQHATGEWLMFTDADVFFQQGTLRKALDHSIHENADHLTLLPRVDTGSFWMEVTMAAFRLMFMSSAKISALEKPDSDAFIGVGAFNLIKKSTFDRSKGFEWLRMEVIDDMGLGLLMKNAGGKTKLAYADKHLNLTGYHSLGGMFKGLEKNAFGPGTGYKYSRCFIIFLFIWLFNIVPIVAFAYTGVDYYGC